MQKELLSDEQSGYNIEECWDFAKYFISNLAEIWEKGDLDLKQRLQGLITPDGFKFEDNLIKPQKNPHFISIFCHKTAPLYRSHTCLSLEDFIEMGMG